MADAGLPFFRFFDESDVVIYPTGAKYKTLWPTNCILENDVKEQIKINFTNYFVNSSDPQYWLSRFQALIMREQDKWQKLLQSEHSLRPQDAYYNYDMTETTEFSTNGTRRTTNSDSTNNTHYVSETPEGSVDDINSYMSAASKDNNLSSYNGNDTADNTGNQTVTRKGNIGVMTAAQILGGYREATNWCALEEVIFPSLEKLFVMIWEEGEGNGYLYAIN